MNYLRVAPNMIYVLVKVHQCKYVTITLSAKTSKILVLWMICVLITCLLPIPF